MFILKHKPSIIGTLFLACSCFLSCSNEPENFENQQDLLENQQDHKIVSPNHAKTIANAFWEGSSTVSVGANQKSINTEDREIINIHTIHDQEELPALHIINYNPSGYVIVSGHEDDFPILAYSDQNIFHHEELYSQEGPAQWVEDRVGIVEGIRYGGLPGHSSTHAHANCSSDPGANSAIHVAPLMGMTWGQGCYYNEYLSYCAAVDTCYKMPTGCVATAAAMVIKYYEPSNLSYDWSKMEDNLLSTYYEDDRLMKDIGNAIGMSYSCDESASDLPSLINNYLNVNLEWNYTQKSTANSTEIKQQLDNNNPVIVGGLNSEGGHCWVIEGYSHFNNYQLAPGTCSEGSQGMLSFSNVDFFYTNWGWDGDYNGYYRLEQMNPDGDNYELSTMETAIIQ